MKKFQNIKKMMEYNTKPLNTRVRWGAGGAGGRGCPFSFQRVTTEFFIVQDSGIVTLNLNIF